MKSTLSLIEALWIAIVCIGAGGHLVGVVDGIGSLRNLRAAGINGGKEIVARMYLSTEATFLVIKLIFAVVGLRAGTRTQGSTPTVDLFAVLFIAAAVLMDFNTFRNRVSKNKLLGVGLLRTARSLDELRDDVAGLEGELAARSKTSAGVAEAERKA